MELLEVTERIGSANVSAADCGPIPVTMSVIVWVAEAGSAKKPMIPTKAISAGNSARTP